MNQKHLISRVMVVLLLAVFSFSGFTTPSSDRLARRADTELVVEASSKRKATIPFAPVFHKNFHESFKIALLDCEHRTQRIFKAATRKCHAFKHLTVRLIRPTIQSLSSKEPIHLFIG